MSGWELLILSGCSPPPQDKCPANLIHAFGVEMLRMGFEMAVEILEATTDEQPTDKHNS